MNIASHFEIIPLLSGLFWLVACVLFVAWRRSHHTEEIYQKYYFQQFFFKIVGATFFMLVYLFYYGGGDTLAYWEGTEVLNKLFWDSPGKFWDEMLRTPDITQIRSNYTRESGFPPGWIYKEPESFFVSKAFFFLSLLTLKSYIATTFITATICSIASWHFFETVRRLNLHDEHKLALFSLFIPTVLFWGTGVSKDSLVLISLIFLFSSLARVFILKVYTWKTLLMILLTIILIVKIRIFLLSGIMPGILIAYSTRFTKKLDDNQVKKFTFKFFIYSIAIAMVFVFLGLGGGSSLENLYNEAVMIQLDFSSNVTYTGKRYDLGLTDFSTGSMIQSFPISVITAFYRPFPWEATSPLLILNGLENLILIYLTFKLFSEKIRIRIKQIAQNELLIFCLVFSIVIGFSIGFTSGLFGVLVRLKSLILPFIILILTLKNTSKQETQSNNV